ncbi:MAG: hypothetical protein JWO82_1974 [Akkermansiaceae bacterium]|nr:hypothetical protein [Akkermansiaceae bacterium]
MITLPPAVRLPLLLTLAILVAGLAVIQPRRARLRQLREQCVALQQQEVAAQPSGPDAATGRKASAARPGGELKLQAARQLSRDMLVLRREMAAAQDQGGDRFTRGFNDRRVLAHEQLRLLDVAELRAFIAELEDAGGPADAQAVPLLIAALGHLVRINPERALATLSRLSSEDPLFAARACPVVIRLMEPDRAERAALDLPDPWVRKKTLEWIYMGMAEDDHGSKAAFAARHGIPF